MKTTTNEKFIESRTTLARWTGLGGMGVLLLGLIASFNEQYVYWSLPALLVGFILANVSSFNANRYLRQPRPDEALAKALRGLDKNYHLFNYTASVPYVLLTPSQLYSLTAKMQDGVIRQRGNRWHRNFNWRRIIFFFGEEALGNPPRDAELEAERLSRGLARALGDDAPPVHPVAVFTHPQAQLEREESVAEGEAGTPVLTSDELKKYIRAESKGTPFDPALKKQLLDFLKGDVG
jgi:hypothetical protein